MAPILAFLPAFMTTAQGLATTMSVVGAVVSAGSAYAAANQQADAAEYNAQVAEQNAKRSLDEGAAAQAAQNRQARHILGTQRAAIAQSATGFGGSNADILEQSATLAELDTLNIAYGAQSRATGYQSQAQLDRFAAGNARKSGRNALAAGLISAGGSLLGGVSRYGAAKNMGNYQVGTPTYGGNYQGLDP